MTLDGSPVNQSECEPNKEIKNSNNFKYENENSKKNLILFFLEGK